MSKQNKLDFFSKSPKVSDNTTADEPIPLMNDVSIWHWYNDISIFQQCVTFLSGQKSWKTKSDRDPLYLEYGLTYKDDCPPCVIFSKVLTNSHMAPAKLKRHSVP